MVITKNLEYSELLSPGMIDSGILLVVLPIGKSLHQSNGCHVSDQGSGSPAEYLQQSPRQKSAQQYGTSCEDSMFVSHLLDEKGV